MSEDLETPVDVEPVVAPNGGESNSDPAGNQPTEPFLSVNERTVYKTRDDAVKAYDEAGRRIAQLSGWEKTGKEVGIEDPKVIKTLVNEVLELRQLKAKFEKEGAVGGKVQPTSTDPEGELDPKEKAARDWLKKALPAMGYIPKEELLSKVEELNAQITELKNSGTQSEAQRFKNQEAEARNDLSTLVKGDFGDDPSGKKSTIIGTLIKDRINSDDELVARWRQGGLEAKNLIKELYDEYKTELPWTKPAPPAPNVSAATAASKGKAVAANKKLPAPGTAAQPHESAKPKDKWAERHKRAREIFEATLTGA